VSSRAILAVLAGTFGSEDLPPAPGETPPPDPGNGEALPQVTVSQATSIGETVATLTYTIETLGDQDAVDAFVRYRETGETEWDTTAPVERTAAGSYPIEVTGLTTDTDHEYEALLAAHSWTPRQRAILDCVYYFGIEVLDGTSRIDNGLPVMQVRADLNITNDVFNEIDVALERCRPYLWPILNPRNFTTETDIHTDGLPYYGGGGPRGPGSINGAYDA
jgi:hypothetical protein